MRTEASNNEPCHFRSEQYNMNITLPTVTTMTGKVLVAANQTTIYRYDLSRWLDTTNITGVTETDDTNNLITSTGYTGTILTINVNSAEESKTATLTVNAGGIKVLTLTVEAVNVVGTGGEGILWVRPFYPSENYIDGNPTAQDISNAWSKKAAELGFTTSGMESFALRPLNAVGGDLADNAQNATITWRPSQSASVTFDSGSFIVLHIPKSGINDIKQLEFERGTDALTFTAEDQGGLYAVLYKPAETVHVTWSLKLGTEIKNSFVLGQQMTAEITVAKENSSTSTAVPTGNVLLYLGDPKNGGKLLGSYEIKTNDNGKAIISYTVTEDVVKHGIQQTLYFVYEGNYSYLPKTETTEVTFNERSASSPRRFSTLRWMP